MQNREPSIEEKLHTWLEAQGYPLEMRVAKAFQIAGARVIQSEYYTDPSTEESREIDVVADWQTRIDNLLVRVSFVIECKSSKDKPWILFVSPNVRLAAPARVIVAAYRVCEAVAKQNGVNLEAQTPPEILEIVRDAGDLYR